MKSQSKMIVKQRFFRVWTSLYIEKRISVLETEAASDENVVTSLETLGSLHDQPWVGENDVLDQLRANPRELYIPLLELLPCPDTRKITRRDLVEETRSKRSRSRSIVERKISRTCRGAQKRTKSSSTNFKSLKKS